MKTQWKLVTALALQTSLWICLADESTRHCSDLCMCCTHGLCNDANKCDGCVDGYTGPNCMEACHANCKNCSQTYLKSRICYVCKDGYYIGKNKDLDSQPLQKDCTLACKQDCKICNSYSNCTECKAGYILDASNDCKKCPDQCQICISETVCLKCDESYYWDKSACSHCMKPCKSCSSSQECDICPDGHLLFKGSCLECAKPCKSCKVIAEREQVCYDCAEGYYIHEHECLKCSEHCTSCLNATNCKMCENKYKPYKGKCFLCETPCTSCSSDNICASCQDKYFNLNMKCIMYPKSCFLCLTDIMFKANSSSFLPANNSFVCPDKINLCKDMYTIDNCEAYNADCLQDMCKLIAGECRNTGLPESTTKSSIQGVNSEDKDNSTIAWAVVCGILSLIILLGLSVYIIKHKVYKKKQSNADDIGQNVPKEAVPLLLLEILKEYENQLSSNIDPLDKEDLSSCPSENSQNVTKDTVGGDLNDGEKTTDVDCETTGSTKKNMTIQEIDADIQRLQKKLNQLHEEKAVKKLMKQYHCSDSEDLKTKLRHLWPEKKNSTSLQSMEASAGHRTGVPLLKAGKEKRANTTKAYVDGYVRKLTETELGNTGCRKVLDSLRRHNITFENLAYFGNQLKEKVPQFPEEVPNVCLEILNKYGSGYTNFIPFGILKTCKIYQVSGKDNCCLFNAVSVALYGDENQASMLKLLTVILGAADIEVIVEELMRRYKTEDDVKHWSAMFISDDKYKLLSGPRRVMLENIVKDEVKCTINNSDSGACQLEILAHIIGRQIKVYWIKDQELCFGKHEHLALKLVYVPYCIEKSKKDGSFNHFVPAIETKTEEKVCLAESVGLCQGQQDNWVRCGKCHQWLHSYCVFGDDKDDKDTKEVEDCGCTKIRPFAPERCGALCLEEEIVHGTLQELEIQGVLMDLMKPGDQAKFPSWRKREISTTQVLQADTLFAVDGKVFEKIKNFIEGALEMNVEAAVMFGVLVPEVLVRLIMKVEQCNRLEAECILKDCKENTKNET